VTNQDEQVTNQDEQVTNQDEQVTNQYENLVGINSTELNENIGICIQENPMLVNIETQNSKAVNEKRRMRGRNNGITMF